jgi:type II secretory pathway pseudopilin PulG
MAVVIISLTAVALLGALQTSITSSAEQRALAADDTLAKSLAEQARYSIELRTSPAALFQNCTTAASYSNAALNWSLPTGYVGYSASVVSVVYWSGSQFDPNITQATCSSTYKNGIQQLIIRAAAPSGTSIQLSTVVRDPNCQTYYASSPC